MRRPRTTSWRNWPVRPVLEAPRGYGRLRCHGSGAVGLPLLRRESAQAERVHSIGIKTVTERRIYLPVLLQHRFASKDGADHGSVPVPAIAIHVGFAIRQGGFDQLFDLFGLHLDSDPARKGGRYEGVQKAQ